MEKAKLDGVDITVISDGSTDRTVELASKYLNRIKLIVFKQNKGYGAAIKTAWQESDADILGFIDADGTCDPLFFGNLCQAMFQMKSDIVLGSRMNKKSGMPAIRRLGNLIFALMLSLFSSKKVRDTASGMRIIHRRCLPNLMPLPDGLHFTPAMSARAILSSDISISEIEMPYHEREGKSKLHALRDGIRFMKVILATAFLYRPARGLMLIGAFCLLIGSLLMIMPAAYYFSHRKVLEWMIYRFIVSDLLGIAAMLFFCFAYLSSKIVDLTLTKTGIFGRANSLLSKLFNMKSFWILPITFMLMGGLLVMPSFVQLMKTGMTNEHWSRFIVMSFLFSISFILIVTRLLNYSLHLIAARLNYLRSEEYSNLLKGTDLGK
jgi:glycosyltransferase involved in cell wall biosynthesis